MPISVVIPTYRNPSYLDLCLKSAFEGQDGANQIIVVVDGYFEESETVLQKYPDVDTIVFEENKGQMTAHNTGVTLAENESILIVNDDNVFPKHWDSDLLEVYSEKLVIAPNQIEPAPSIFKSFVCKQFGTDPRSFNSEAFHHASQLERQLRLEHKWSDDGCTWPLYMSKKLYMAVGGFDLSFPSPAVADHDLFMRFQMVGLQCKRYFGVHFYHFGGTVTKKTATDAFNHAKKEAQSFEYFNWKWNFIGQFDKNNSSLPRNQKIRGIQF